MKYFRIRLLWSKVLQRLILLSFFFHDVSIPGYIINVFAKMLRLVIQSIFWTRSRPWGDLRPLN
jgi:hypothetical protein